MENQNLICEKAKTKKDGVYRLRGVDYRVKDGRATHFGANGKILENFGGFNVVLGKYRGGCEEARRLLKKITT